MANLKGAASVESFVGSKLISCSKVSTQKVVAKETS
jgi:hypothetical protein